MTNRLLCDPEMSAAWLDEYLLANLPKPPNLNPERDGAATRARVFALMLRPSGPQRKGETDGKP